MGGAKGEEGKKKSNKSQRRNHGINTKVLVEKCSRKVEKNHPLRKINNQGE